MKIYFRMHCKVMPTFGRLHLPDNYTCDELYQIYKQDMEAQKERYVHHSQFTRLWNANFDNVVIARKVRMGVCAICANLKSMIKDI
jgi:Cdc6-like AAA superfamily ATPase